MRRLLLEGFSCGVGVVMGAVLTLAASGQEESDTAIPKRYPMERYQTFWQKSPFEVPTNPPPPPPKEEPQFAKNLHVAGVMEIGEITLVTIRNQATGEYFELGPKKIYKGFRLVEVTQHEDPTKVEVEISQGKNNAVIGYDAKALAAAPKAPGGQPLKPSTLAQGPNAGNGNRNSATQSTGTGKPAPNGKPAGANPSGNKPGASPNAPAGNGSKGQAPNSGQTKPSQPVRTPKERLRIVVPGNV